MIKGYSAPMQTLLGSLLTWGLTAAGSSLVFVCPSEHRKVLDGSLGFAGGVMLAASFWSLLEPAISISKETIEGSFLPVMPTVVGFLAGALFVYTIDLCLPEPNLETFQQALVGDATEVGHHYTYEVRRSTSIGDLRKRNFDKQKPLASEVESLSIPNSEGNQKAWRRILLLVIAVTVHNIPEGIAVGVGFGSIGKSASATFENARNLALGIGIQNFPEGLAVSLPLRGCGLSPWMSFWWGQLSGLVEPFAAMSGLAAIHFFQPLLPYALAFAAGAMIYVVIQELVPEAHSCGNGKVSSWSFILGFLIMMILDVGLG